VSGSNRNPTAARPETLRPLWSNRADHRSVAGSVVMPGVPASRRADRTTMPAGLKTLRPSWCESLRRRRTQPAEIIAVYDPSAAIRRQTTTPIRLHSENPCDAKSAKSTTTKRLVTDHDGTTMRFRIFPKQETNMTRMPSATMAGGLARGLCQRHGHNPPSQWQPATPTL
jgi:hypothetical protein